MITEAEWTKLCNILSASKYFEIGHPQYLLCNCNSCFYDFIHANVFNNNIKSFYIKRAELSSIIYDSVCICRCNTNNEKIRSGGIRIAYIDKRAPIIIFPLVLVSDCSCIINNTPLYTHYIAQIHPPDTFDLKPTNRRIEL